MQENTRKRKMAGSCVAKKVKQLLYIRRDPEDLTFKLSPDLGQITRKHQTSPNQGYSTKQPA